MDWLADQEDSRPQPPPTLDVATARALFLSPNLRLLPTRTGLPRSRARLLARMPAVLRSLEKCERLYSDESPKTLIGSAHEWNECRRAAEDLKRLVGGYLALLMEEEGE